MGLLDGIMGGGAMGMIPGANVLTVIAKGLDLIKDLIEKGNTQAADAVLKFLNEVLKESPHGAAHAAEPQPFTPPPSQTGGPSSSVLNMEISTPEPLAAPVSHDCLPTVDGSPQGDQMLSQAARPFVEGSPASVERALTPGSQEWTSVMWAMQKNPNIQYNADSQRFFVKLADGNKLDVCSLEQVQGVIQKNGGFDRGNPVAADAVGAFLAGKIGGAYGAPITAKITLDIATISSLHPNPSSDTTVDDLNRQIEELKRKLKALEAAQQVMQPASSNITVTVGR